VTAPAPQFKSFPDEAHQDLLNRAYAADQKILDQTISVTDAMMLINGLAMVAQQLGAAIPAAEATHTAIYARIAALEARTLVGTTGQLTKTLPILLGSVTTFDVVFRNPMPSTDYIPLVTLDNASVAVLGAVSVQLPITAKTKTGCTVTVRNTALLTVASSVTVQVAALQLA
jgi:hypothetical protein